MSNLTPKQEGFVKDYLDTGNATEAAHLYWERHGSSPTRAAMKDILDEEIQDFINYVNHANAEANSRT